MATQMAFESEQKKQAADLEIQKLRTKVKEQVPLNPIVKGQSLDNLP